MAAARLGEERTRGKRDANGDGLFGLDPKLNLLRGSNTKTSVAEETAAAMASTGPWWSEENDGGGRDDYGGTTTPGRRSREPRLETERVRVAAARSDGSFAICRGRAVRRPGERER